MKVHRGPLVGLIGQLAVLAVLTAVVGLDAVGWLVGTAWGLVISLALSAGLTRAGRRVLGAANRVTLLRATLVGGVAALVGGTAPAPAGGPVLVGIAAVALVLDGVDGRVARRTGTVSALGARFDMEVDAFLILVLSVDVARTFGPAVLAIGAARYAVWVAAWVVPWMRRPVPPRYWRKPVAAIQGIVLTAAVAGLVPRPATVVAIAVAMVLLAESFGRDVVWQWRRRSLPQSATAPSTAAALLPSTALRARR